MHTLTAGANAPLSHTDITLRIRSGVDIDAAAYRLTAQGKVRGDGDMVFYGQTQSDDHSIRRSGSDRDTVFTVQLQQQPAEIERIAFAFSNPLASSALGNLSIDVEQQGQVLLHCPVDLTGRSETALILGECYRRNGAWKFRFVAQGFNGGLKPLSEHFGVEISDDAPASPPPAPTPKVNLSKITLDKQQPRINLAKQDNFGHIKINLNWQRGSQTPQKSGFLSQLWGNKNQGVDLDLGAFIRLRDGNAYCVQALGNSFGNLHTAPYVCLRGDDRTGQIAEGEWLEVNGSRWTEISEVLIFAFIYDGVPNWDATDGVVKLYVQEQEIETHLTEGNPQRGMCAVARLLNDNGSIRVERINRYFSNHKDMDEAFGWGFRWKAGSK